MSVFAKSHNAGVAHDLAEKLQFRVGKGEVRAREGMRVRRQPHQDGVWRWFRQDRGGCHRTLTAPMSQNQGGCGQRQPDRSQMPLGANQ